MKAITMAKKKKQEVQVLSVRQPWAELILSGVKWCENRSWKTTFRGRLYIHASRCDSLPTEDWESYKLSKEKLTTGAIVGHVELVDIVWMGADTGVNWSRVFDHVEEQHPDLPTDNDRMIHVEGPYCWILKKPTRLRKPIPTGGKLRLWKFKL